MTCTHHLHQISGWADLLKQYDYKHVMVFREHCCKCRADLKEWSENK